MLPGDTPILALAVRLEHLIGRLHGYALGVAHDGDVMWSGAGSPMRVDCVRPTERFHHEANDLVHRGARTHGGTLFNSDAEPFVSERRDVNRVAEELGTRISNARARFISAAPPTDLIAALDALAADAMLAKMLDPGMNQPDALTAKLALMESRLHVHVSECAKHTSWMEGWAPELNANRSTKRTVRHGALARSHPIKFKRKHLSLRLGASGPKGAPEQPTRRVSLVKAAKKWFGCDEETLKSMIHSKLVRVTRITERQWIFDCGEVDAQGFCESPSEYEPGPRSNKMTDDDRRSPTMTEKTNTSGRSKATRRRH
jgi:hypothetical protein